MSSVTCIFQLIIQGAVKPRPSKVEEITYIDICENLHWWDIKLTEKLHVAIYKYKYYTSYEDNHK